MGRGGAAESIHGEFRMARRGIAAHFGACRGRQTVADRYAGAPSGHAHLQCGPGHAAADRAGRLRFRIARELRSGRRGTRRGSARWRTAAGGGRARRAVQSDAGEFRPHFFRWLCRGLLQLQMGGSPRRRRLRRVRTGRCVRRRNRRPLSRFHPCARRKPGCDGGVCALPGPPTRRPPVAQANRNCGVRRVGALVLALAAADARAATAYVSDELVLGVYSEQNQQGQRLTTLHSGASVETLAAGGEFTQVRLSDGVIGWVKTAYLTEREPATVRVKRLDEELARSRATSPALAEAAA